METEVSFIQDGGIPTAINWWHPFTGAVGLCMGQQQTEICGSADVSTCHAIATRCSTNGVSCYLGLAGLLTTALTKYVNEMVPKSKLRGFSERKVPILVQIIILGLFWSFLV